MTDEPSQSRHRIRIVEVLVILFCLFGLVALLLPAIQTANYRGVRMSCSNNLKQIGLAAHNYANTHGGRGGRHKATFPPGWLSSEDASGNRTLSMWSWSALMLPFLEQQALYEQLQVQEATLDEAITNRLDFLQKPIACFRCPQSTGPELNREPYRLVGKSGEAMPMSNYVGVNNSSTLYAGDLDKDDPGQNGVFRKNFSMKLHDIPDGTANTLMFGERVFEFKATDGQTYRSGAGVLFGMSADSGTPPDEDPNDDTHLEERMGSIVGGGATRINYNHASVRLDQARSSNFSSHHPGGAQFAVCDGTVTFISNKVDFDHVDQISEDDIVDSVFERLLSRDDGQQVSLQQ